MLAKTVRNIKTLKIQGAQSVALEASFSLISIINKKHTSKSKFLEEMRDARKKLFNARPTEPCLRNALHYIFDLDTSSELENLKKEFLQRIQYVKTYFNEAEKNIQQYASKKIQKGSIVYTHCHSGTVTKSLIKAKKDGQNFSVVNTETRPLFQGRITAKELSKNGIDVTHYVDAAMRLALKKADIIFLGSDAITSEGDVFNKIGSELIAEMAYKFDIPLYICTCSWKFDPMSIFGFEEKVEKRFAGEVWKNPPKNVTISNYAFEKVKANLVTGIISELGIFKPGFFVEETLEKYHWMLNKN